MIEYGRNDVICDCAKAPGRVQDFSSRKLEVSVSDITDKNERNNATSDTTTQSATLQSPGRRQFSRSALASGAVLLSLGNRSAWGQTVAPCMSVATLNSFNPVTGMFASVPGGRPEHDEALASEIHLISEPDDGNYLANGVTGSDGQIYSTCQDPTDADGVCLVEGSNCP